MGPVAIMDGDGTGRPWAGPDDAAVQMRAGPYELFRATFGRRSRAQVARRLVGASDVDPLLDHLFVFGPTEHDLVE